MSNAYRCGGVPQNGADFGIGPRVPLAFIIGSARPSKYASALRLQRFDFRFDRIEVGIDRRQHRLDPRQFVGEADAKISRVAGATSAPVLAAA